MNKSAAPEPASLNKSSGNGWNSDEIQKIGFQEKSGGRLLVNGNGDLFFCVKVVSKVDHVPVIDEFC